LTKSQKKQFSKTYHEDGQEYIIIATVRYDDECGNGHNTFSITGEVWKARGGRKVGSNCEMAGCIHDAITQHFPELAPLVKWHLCASDGPMHYLANTIYHAGDRDHNGLRKGEQRQLRNGKTGLLAWKLEADVQGLPQYVDADEQPTQTATLRYVPWMITGEGKARELDHARSSAVWPNATDEELTAPDLKERLETRLPQLMTEFRQAVESLGFTY
jgi:hypothetical protein